MTTETLLDLAARCEAAKGPSAEERQCVIDAYDLIFPHELMLSEEEKGDGGTRYRRSMHRAAFTNYINTDYHRASLDAAMMLVPEGWEWAGGFEDGGAFAHVHPRGEYAGLALASTPALALCAASLRASAKDEGR